MPCNSDHMEARANETLSRETAKLIVWLDQKMKAKTEDWIVTASKEYYGNEPEVDTIVAGLCARIRAMPEDQLNTIVYNGRDATARKLADWWEEHQKADTKREAQEQRALAKERSKRLHERSEELLKLVDTLLGEVPLLTKTDHGRRLVELMEEIG